MAQAPKPRCQWIDRLTAFNSFATHSGLTQSAGHIKPLHWYIACRLVLEGGFHPESIMPRPPFSVVGPRRKDQGWTLRYDPSVAEAREQTVLGGLKTKNVDVVVTNKTLGPVLAISCKGVTGAFRNLTNRMEETIGECTNLHITYPALVLGYFTLLRANRTISDAISAPLIEADPEVTDQDSGESNDGAPPETAKRKVASTDLAFSDDGTPIDGIVRFHAALSEMSSRRGIRDEISRYEAIALAMVEPSGKDAGAAVSDFPPDDSPLRFETFFATLYQRYEERFVYGAPLLVSRAGTARLEWGRDSPVIARTDSSAVDWPALDYEPRVMGT